MPPIGCGSPNPAFETHQWCDDRSQSYRHSDIFGVFAYSRLVGLRPADRLGIPEKWTAARRDDPITCACCCSSYHDRCPEDSLIQVFYILFWARTVVLAPSKPTQSGGPLQPKGSNPRRGNPSSQGAVCRFPLSPALLTMPKSRSLR